jgi:ferredoxin
MTEDVYEALADALDRLPNAFPRTKSNVEIAILRKIFSTEEARIASKLSGEMEPVEAIAERLGLSVNHATAKLASMAYRGMLWYGNREGKPHFRLAPFIVGIYEAQVSEMDHEFAHLIEKYMTEGGAAGIMKPQPALHRVVPAQKTVKTESILPYDDVRAILMSSKVFHVRNCICRVQQEYVGRKCDFPVKSCITFSSTERPSSQGEAGIDERTSQEGALALLDKFEEIGLVHTVGNVRKGIGYICNCCGCCCGILRGITEFGIENSVARANYFAVIDPDRCQGCGTCIKRCQVHAISERNSVAVVDERKCIGCGLCVTGCPNEAAELQRKPNHEIVEPPLDYATWERERLNKRRLVK